MGTPKRLRRKVRERSLGDTADLWNPEFSACELGRQVTMADASKDNETNMALARAVLLPNDVPEIGNAH